MSFQMSPSCLCCGPDCGICSDDWAGIADGPDISTGTDCGWTKTAGAWSVASNKLRTSSTSAIALSNTTQATSADEGHRVSVVASTDTDGGKLRIVLDYADADNYWFAELEIGASKTMRIVERTAGVETDRGTLTTSTMVSTAYRLDFCISDGLAVFRNHDKNDVIVTNTVSLHAGADKFGVGTGTVAGTCDFDDFDGLKRNADCPCPAGSDCAQCETATAPAEVLVTLDLADVGGGCAPDACADLSGDYFLPEESACLWREDQGNFDCNFDDCTFSISANKSTFTPGKYVNRVIFSFAGPNLLQAEFRTAEADQPINCTTEPKKTLPFHSITAFPLSCGQWKNNCDWNNATVTYEPVA